MKKRVFAVIMSIMVAVSATACSSNSSNRDSSLVESSTIEETPSVSSEADASGEDTGLQEQTALSLLSPVMEELGETESISITSIEKMNSPEEESHGYTVDFSAGERQLSAYLFENDGAFSVYSVTAAEDHSHFYYFPSLATSSNLTGISFQLYDYKTDEALPPPEVELDSEEVADIISKIPEISVNPDTTGGPMLYLDVNVEAASTEEIATSFYGSCLQFLVEFIQLDPIPYSAVTFNIMLDDTIRLGYMQMVAFPEMGILGTEPPVMEIEEETTSEIFAQKYEEYMYAIDADNIAAGITG